MTTKEEVLATVEAWEKDSGVYLTVSRRASLVAILTAAEQRGAEREREWRAVLSEALNESGCDGDLCAVAWHGRARHLLGIDQ